MVSSRKTRLKGGKKIQPSFWQPPVELSEQEEQVVKRVRKARLFVFLRQHRHELLDETLRRDVVLTELGPNRKMVRSALYVSLSGNIARRQAFRKL